MVVDTTPLIFLITVLVSSLFLFSYLVIITRTSSPKSLSRFWNINSLIPEKSQSVMTFPKFGLLPSQNKSANALGLKNLRGGLFFYFVVAVLELWCFYRFRKRSWFSDSASASVYLNEHLECQLLFQVVQLYVVVVVLVVLALGLVQELF